jgi:hypothetical protein
LAAFYVFVLRKNPKTNAGHFLYLFSRKIPKPLSASKNHFKAWQHFMYLFLMKNPKTQYIGVAAIQSINLTNKLQDRDQNIKTRLH